MRYAVLVTGPAGAGKSTFCRSFITHLHNSKRGAHLVNLDPAADAVEYEPSIDIKDLISLQDVMDDMNYGPNGGLVYCFELVLLFVSLGQAAIGLVDTSSRIWTG